MNEPNSAAGEHGDVAQPLEITTFYPEKAGGSESGSARPRVVSTRTLKDYRGIAIALFLATCLSVFAAGLEPGGGLPTLAELLYKAYAAGRLPEVLHDLAP